MHLKISSAKMAAILSANQFTDGGEGCDEGTELSSLLVCYAFDGMCSRMYLDHDGVIKWKHFPRFWPFVQGIHQ